MRYNRGKNGKQVTDTTNKNMQVSIFVVERRPVKGLSDERSLTQSNLCSRIPKNIVNW